MKATSKVERLRRGDRDEGDIEIFRNRAGLSLRANLTWTFIGGVVYQASQWGWLVVLARTASQQRVGEFILALSLTAPIIILSQLQLRSIQAIDATRERPFGLYLSLRIVSTLVALLIIVGIAILTSSGTETIVIILVGIAKGFESLSDAYHGLMQQNERLDLMAKAKMIKGPVSLVALALLVYLTGSIVWGLLGLIAVWAALLFLYDIPNTIHITRTDPMATEDWLKARWDRSAIIRLAWTALPLGVVMMLASLHANVPRYAVDYFLGPEMLAIFGAMVYFIAVGKMVVNSLTYSSSPRLGQYYAAGMARAFTRLVIKLAVTGAGLGVAGMLLVAVLGKELLTIFYGPEYASAAHVFVWLMGAEGLGFVAMFLGSALTAARYFRIQLPLQIVTVGTTAVASLVLVPPLGLVGAALAVLAGVSVRVLLLIPILVHITRRLHESGPSRQWGKGGAIAAQPERYSKDMSGVVSGPSPRPDSAAPALPSVSVFMTVHNGERFVRETIQSILGQTRTDFEFVIVDDGSTDRTSEIVASFEDGRLRLLQPGRLGRGAALVLAANECRGRWLANIDADDPAHPRRLELQLAAAQRYPEYGVVATKARLFEGDGVLQWPMIVLADNTEDSSPDEADLEVRDVTDSLLWHNPISHSTALILRRAYIEVGGYDRSKTAQLDYHLWISFARCGWRIGRLELPLQAHRLHPNQSFEASKRLVYVKHSFRTQLRAGREVYGLPALLVAPLAGARLGYGLLPRGLRLWLRGAGREKGG